MTNVGQPQANTDASTKSYVDGEVNNTLKLDGSNKMSGALNMDNRRIENVGAGRHNTADALTHLQLEAFYADLNTTVTGNIEVQNPIDMQDQRIKGVAEPIHHKNAATKFYIDDFMTQKADKTELASYLKRDGLQDMTENLDMNNKKVINLADPTGINDATGKGYVDRLFLDSLRLDGSSKMTGNLDMNNNKITNLADPIHISDATGKGYVDRLFLDSLRLDGSSKMTGNLDMNNNKITNLADPIHISDATGKGYVDRLFLDSLRLDGSSKMTGNLDMNNSQIKNVKNATHNQDAVTLKQVNDAIATTSTDNNKYTDQKIAESHISTHKNRKNVLKYAMDDGEFTEDYGIQDVNLITFNDSPHKTNKKAFSLKVQKTSDGSNLFKGRFDFNLFKMIRDDFSDNYTVCIETYFERNGRYGTEFNRFNIQFERLNMNIDNYNTIRINSDYKYFRSILNLSPDGTSKQIQRRLYVTVQSAYDNLSPTLLPIYVLIYGIKGEAKNDLDFTIYDYKKAYEVADNKFQLHVPIDMNNQKITNLANASSDGDAVGRKYLADRILRSYVFFKTRHKRGQDWNLEDKYL